MALIYDEARDYSNIHGSMSNSKSGLFIGERTPLCKAQVNVQIQVKFNAVLIQLLSRFSPVFVQVQSIFSPVSSNNDPKGTNNATSTVGKHKWLMKIKTVIELRVWLTLKCKHKYLKLVIYTSVLIMFQQTFIYNNEPTTLVF